MAIDLPRKYNYIASNSNFYSIFINKFYIIKFYMVILTLQIDHTRTLQVDHGHTSQIDYQLTN